MQSQYRMFREQYLMIERDEMARRLGIPEEEYARIEDGGPVPHGFLRHFCEVIQVSPNDFLGYIPPKPAGISTADVYRETRLKHRLLRLYLEPEMESFRQDPGLQEELQSARQILGFIDTCGSKPVVAFVGPSDAGKSTLINCITGIDALLTHWTPATSATVLLKHIEDRPRWMGTDTVWVFRAESKEVGWDFRRYSERAYCADLKVAGGDLSILAQYCSREGAKRTQSVDSAVVYLESDFLRACDVIDLPGFGTESYSENVQAQRAKEKADIVVFLCQANAFFNKHEDVLFLKDIIYEMPVINASATLGPLSNLFIVATQAHTVDNGGLARVFERGRQVLGEQISNDVIMERFRVPKGEFMEHLGERFFSYSIENSLLRREFEREIRFLLEKTVPRLRKGTLDQGVAEFRLRATRVVRNKIRQTEAIWRDREIAAKEYEAKVEKRDAFVREVTTKTLQLREAAQYYRQKDAESMRTWEAETIYPESIERVIADKGYDRKQAKDYLAGNIADLYLAKTTQLVTNSVLGFNEEVEESIAALEQVVGELEKTEMGSVAIPFDVRGAWAGGLAGAGVLGALSLAAGAAGNLGGYILVAKGVSVLSALGVSVGGTAAAASWVAAIGGPVTLAIALGFGAWCVVKAIFGEKWQTRLAKQVSKVFREQKVLQQYIEKMDELWDQTEEGLQSVSDTIVQKYDEDIENRKAIIETQSEDELRQRVERYREIRDFFAELPWEGSDLYFAGAALLEAAAQRKGDSIPLSELEGLFRQVSELCAGTYEVLEGVRTAFKTEPAVSVDRQWLESAVEQVVSKLVQEKVSFSNDHFYRDEEIRHKMMDGFAAAKSEINIACAWIGRATDAELRKALDKALRRGVVVKILYGIDSDSNTLEARKKKDVSEEMAASLRRDFGNKGLVLKRGNTHNKLFICDDEYYLIGSFNFLSYNPVGHAGQRDELVQYSENPRALQELRRWYFAFG